MYKVKYNGKDQYGRNVDFEYNIGSGYVSISFIGSMLSVILSSALNHSFWWGLFHFFCGWIYVLYALLCRSKEIMPAIQAMFMM